MKTPRRYTSEEQIIKEIDRCKQTAETSFHYEVQYRAEVAQLKAENNPENQWIIEEKTKMADRARVRGINLMEKRLKKLSEKLAEFRTRLLPCCDDGDTSIPVKIARVA